MLLSGCFPEDVKGAETSAGGAVGVCPHWAQLHQQARRHQRRNSAHSVTVSVRQSFSSHLRLLLNKLDQQKVSFISSPQFKNWNSHYIESLLLCFVCFFEVHWSLQLMKPWTLNTEILDYYYFCYFITWSELLAWAVSKFPDVSVERKL